MRSPFIVRALFIVHLILFASFGPASAQTPATRGKTPAASRVERVERLFAEGAVLYRARKYRQAIAKFERAYAIYPEINLLYNTARAYEAIGQIERAIKTYRRFIDDPQSDKPARRKAHRRLTMLESALARPALSTKPLAPIGETPRSRSGIATAKWVLGASALVAAATGTAMVMLGDKDYRKIDEAISDAKGGIVQMSRVEAQALADAGEKKKTIAYVLYGVGGAALVTSAVLFFVDRQAPHERRSASFDVALLHRGASLLYSGRF